MNALLEQIGKLRVGQVGKLGKKLWKFPIDNSNTNVSKNCNTSYVSYEWMKYYDNVYSNIQFYNIRTLISGISYFIFPITKNSNMPFNVHRQAENSRCLQRSSINWFISFLIFPFYASFFHKQFLVII